LKQQQQQIMLTVMHM